MRRKMDWRGVIRKALAAIVIAMMPVIAMAATILPQGKTQFLDNNGNPLSAGTVTFYIPSTTTPKNTWQDAAKVTLNSNPVVLDAGGRATIYGEGSYRMIVKNAAGSTIYDAVTAGSGADSGSSSVIWGGTSGGSANAQTITASDFTGADGQVIAFIAGLTNTGALTIDPTNFAATAIRKDLPGGPVALVGGEVRAGNLIMAVYSSSAGYFHLVNQPDPFGGQAIVGITAATTTDVLGSNGTVVSVTGAATITSFGTRPNQFKIVYFLGASTITYNATTLIIPGAANITTSAGDAIGVISDGSGNARIVWYQGPGVTTFNPAVDNLFTATQSITIPGVGAVLNGVSTNASSVQGPTFNAFRNSASPAASDIIGAFIAEGNDSAAVRTTYGSLGFTITDPVDATEDAAFSLGLMIAGSFRTPITQVATTTTLTAVDNGGTEAPNLTLFRDSASPTTADGLGIVQFTGRDSAANVQVYTQEYAQIQDATSGSEDAVMVFQTAVAGAIGSRMLIEGGVYHPSASGGDQGNNTINFGNLYRNGTAVYPGGAYASFRVQRSSNQAISATTDTDIAWNAEQFDTGGFFATPSWTPPAGYVGMWAGVTVTAVAGTDVAIRVKKNGTTIQGNGGVTVASAAYATGAVNVTISLIDLADGSDAYKLAIYCGAACTVQFEQPTLSEIASYFQGAMMQ